MCSRRTLRRRLSAGASRAAPAALAFVLGLQLAACASRPTWVHRPPASLQGSGASSLQLEGRWLRPSPTRLSVGHPDGETSAKEEIRFEAERYLKEHSFELRFGERQRREAYREEGSWRAYGNWVILTPAKAWRAQQEKVDDSVWPAPDWQAVDTPPPLLHHYDGGDQRRPPSLMPLVFEQMGALHAEGLYQSALFEYDEDSPSFQNERQVLSEKRNWPHDYRKESRQ